MIGNSLNNNLFFGAIALLATVISIIRFQHDKKWLERTDVYIRIKIKRSYWKSGMLLLVSLGIGLIFQEVFTRLKYLIREGSINTWIVVALATSISNYYHKFVDSIKSFDNGIQLPGRQSEILSWKEIYQFEFEEKILISSSKGEAEFEIDSDDVGFTQEMITDWESKKKGKN